MNSKKSKRAWRNFIKVELKKQLEREHKQLKAYKYFVRKTEEGIAQLEDWMRRETK